MQESTAHAPVLTEKDAAAYLGVSPSYLTQSRLRRRRTDGPPFVKIGRAVRYVREDLEAFVAARRRTASAS